MNKTIELTIPQARAFYNIKKKNFWEWGRGAGKSTGLAYGMRSFISQMPRASFFLTGATYSQILSRTLPSTIEGLEMFNLYQDIDFTVGKSGKKLGFEMPYQPPNMWNNIIHFSNGGIFQLVSLDNPNTGRGLNSYGGIGDEAALLDPERLFNNVKTTNRAKKEIFSKCSMLGAEIYASSTPLTKKGQWFTAMEKTAKQDPKNYYYSKANAFTNRFLRKEWFNEMKKESPSEMLYNAEILNIRPREITNGFYSNIKPSKHYYTDFNQTYLETIGVNFTKKEHYNSNQDADVKPNEPLILSLDFGVFNCAVVSQDQGAEYRVLNSFWVKNPRLLSDLIIEQFIPYYRTHQDKTIFLYGGHEGNNRLPNSTLTLFEQVREILVSFGWSVHLLTRGAAATHYERYLLINAMLKETERKLPVIRINESNNEDLIIALERTEAIEGGDGVRKNKKDEKNKKFPQEHAPHLTDAFDAPLAARFNDIFKGSNKFAAESSIRVR